MFKSGDKVTYTGPNYNQENTRRAICVSDPYEIQGHTMINIEFEGTMARLRGRFDDDNPWHPANVENLIERVY